MNEKIEIPGLENYTLEYELALESLKAVCRSSSDPSNHEYVSACERVRHAWIRRNGLIADHFDDQGTFARTESIRDVFNRSTEKVDPKKVAEALGAVVDPDAPPPPPKIDMAVRRLPRIDERGDHHHGQG